MELGGGEADPLDETLAAADLLGMVVAMQVAQTSVVDPRGSRWLYEGGGVGLATWGSGDLLAGLVVGLLARGLAPIAARRDPELGSRPQAAG